MKTRIGQLNERITVQSAVLVPDGAGGNLETWINAATIWAEDMPKGSTRSIDMVQNRIFSGVDFRVREGHNIGKLNRIIYDSRVCIIEGIRDWERTDEFQIIETRYSDQTVSIDGDGDPIVITSGLTGKYISFTDGATSATDLDLQGKTILNVYRNGVAPKMITSGTPTGSEVLVSSISGSLTFLVGVSSAEYVYAIYY